MAEKSRLRVGVDIGGTFTDLVVFDESTGELRVGKSFTTPENRATGVLDVLTQSTVDLADVETFVHGTTTATNAVIERKGARVGLLTTKGFRDTLEIMRVNRERHYDLQWNKPVPLVPRSRRFEVTERVDYRGRVVTPLDEEELARVVAEMAAAQVESIAICFLFSFMNPEHERRAADLIRQWHPDIPISVSHQILPEIREYERTSTVVIDAYVKPVMGEYFENLGSALQERGLRGSGITVISSAGGVVPASEAIAAPVTTLQSGPAGGVVGAAYLGKVAGYENLLAIDVGGTSFEVSLIDHGEPTRTTEAAIEWGIPFKIPLVDVKSIGAGGGSIASVDAGGLLQVGPQSAGSQPGPACYGRGGELPTLTDAFVVTGAIDPNYFLGGRVKLHASLAEQAIAKHIAEPLGMTVETAARGIITVAEAAMVGAMQVVSTQRGYDPRDYTLIAYGGAGPLPAVELARELGISRVVVPRFPGAFCAFGGLCADVRFDFVRSYLRPLEQIDLSVLNGLLTELDADARAALQRVDAPADSVLLHTADLRYLGQNFEVNVPIPPGQLDEAAIAEIVLRFNDEHKRLFGHRKLDEELEFVSLRVAAIGTTGKPQHQQLFVANDGEPKGHRPLVMHTGDVVDVPVFERGELPAGWSVAGPLIVEEPESTILIGRDDQVSIDQLGNVVIDIKGGR